MNADLLAGLQDELARVDHDIAQHLEKTNVIDRGQWNDHLLRLENSQRDLQERIREAA